MELTQDEYTLFTGDETVFSEDDWLIIVANASERLASFLCLDSLPEPLPALLKELLANFIFAVQSFKGAGAEKVESKHVRNFTITFKSDKAANAFAKIAGDYADVIEQYSACGNGIDVERSKRDCCGNGLTGAYFGDWHYDRF